ncbi:MAG: hypothetical protein AAGG08_04535, partial [Actinomycetota bacterium]
MSAPDEAAPSTSATGAASATTAGTASKTGAALLGLAWLAFGYFGIHTAFIDDEVQEAAPVF